MTPSAVARTSWRRPRRHSGWYEASRPRVGQETFARVTCGPSGQAAQNERGTGSTIAAPVISGGQNRSASGSCRARPHQCHHPRVRSGHNCDEPTRCKESPVAGDQPRAAMLVGCDVCPSYAPGDVPDGLYRNHESVTWVQYAAEAAEAVRALTPPRSEGGKRWLVTRILAITGLLATCRRRRWSAPMACWTGSAAPDSTRRACSGRCWTPSAAASTGSRRTGTTTWLGSCTCPTPRSW